MILRVYFVVDTCIMVYIISIRTIISIQLFHRHLTKNCTAYILKQLKLYDILILTFIHFLLDRLQVLTMKIHVTKLNKL